MASPEVTGKKTGRRLLDYQALRERGIKFSRVHIGRLEAAKKFPLHVDLGENTIAWFEDEIDDLLEMKAVARDAKASVRVEVTTTSQAQPSPKEVADQQAIIRELSAQLRKARQKRREQSRPNNVGPDST